MTFDELEDKYGTYCAVLVLLLIFGPPLLSSLGTAMQGRKQRIAMADIRSIATAWEARAQNFTTFGFGVVPPRRPNVFYRVSAAEIRRALEPKYIHTFPVKDGWKNDYEFWVSGSGQSYAIRSRGHDGRADSALLLPAGPTRTFDNDITYVDGDFYSYCDCVARP